MKSDLSKFRMPKNTPLESKERVDVKKNQNQTPLSSMVDSAQRFHVPKLLLIKKV